MQTVLEELRKADIRDLEGSFFFENSPDLWRFEKDDSRTIAEVRRSMSDNFRRFVEDLKKMEIVPPEDGRTMILYAHKQAGEPSWYPETAVDLVSADELLEKENLSCIDHYAFEFTPWAEALGFLIADNKLTQDNLTEVLVHFLDELSFFGYEESEMEEEREEVLASAKEAKEHPERLVEWDPEKMREELGLPQKEEYPLEKEYLSQILKKINEYNKYCCVKELEKIKDAIHKAR